MTPLMDTPHRTSDLDRELELARREVSALEREQAEAQARQAQEYQQFLQDKAVKFRHVLDVYLNVYRMIRELDDTWRRQVYRGVERFDERTESAVRSLYGLWVAYSGMFEEKAAYFGRHGSKFDAELDAIGRNKREADQVLRTWEPPLKTSAPSFRPMLLSADETARLRDMFPNSL
jgi:hypothetical protein